MGERLDFVSKNVVEVNLKKPIHLQNGSYFFAVLMEVPELFSYFSISLLSWNFPLEKLKTVNGLKHIEMLSTNSLNF